MFICSVQTQSWIKTTAVECKASAFSKMDYSLLCSTPEFEAPVDIREYLQSDVGLSKATDLAMWQEVQKFIRRRRRFLHRRGDLSAAEIEEKVVYSDDVTF